MTLSAAQTRILRWCSDSYGDVRPIRWLKDRLYYATMHYCERHLAVEW